MKRDSVSTTTSDKSRQSHFNTLKQWGKNRLRQIASRVSTEDHPPRLVDKDVSDIDDFNINETIRINSSGLNRRERKLLHERKPSYSSSERSVPPISVKLRESTTNIRRRRLGQHQREEPNSSSGNWSASSESGRTSIGSEITTTTTHPKSSASSTSLNHHHPPSSGPPSSIISRRRFLNTSASSSITSEGTATPDLQMDFHDEDGSSSVYSCDTEGYYTSFHVDSGLKTLKEEESFTGSFTGSNTPLKSSTTSFESSGNQTVISPENEYELFGRGSTSTTASSAGTVCTTIYSDRPNVPERKSSLSLNRSSSSVSDRNLERSYSNSTVGSVERMGTIKRNGVLLQKEVAALVHQAKEEILSRTESPDSGNNTSSSPIETNSNNSNSSPTQQVRSLNSEFEYSESSDLECVDRIERIRVKTTINTSRIPSMCVITPGNSDDDEKKRKNSSDDQESTGSSVENSNSENSASYPKVVEIQFGKEPEYEIPRQLVKKTTLLPLNIIGKLKGVLPSLKKSPTKEAAPLAEEEEDFLDSLPPAHQDQGEYVTIAETQNTAAGAQHGVYYSNDVLKRNLATVLSGNLNPGTSEYVSLNELPCNIRCDESNLVPAGTTTEGNNQRKGSRVTLDAHGKVVYNSDSLKRRKGAHTTFVPGPCIKQQQQSSSQEENDTECVSSVTNEPQAREHSSAIASPGIILRNSPIQVRPVKKTCPTYNEPTKMHAATMNQSHFIDPGKFQSPKKHLNHPHIIRSADLNKIVRANCVNNSGAVVKRSNSYRMANISPPLIHSLKSTFTFELAPSLLQSSSRTTIDKSTIVWSPHSQLYRDRTIPQIPDISSPVNGSLVKIRRSRTDEGFVEDNSSDESLSASFERLLQELKISSTLNLGTILNSTTFKEQAKSTDDLEKLRRLVEESERDKIAEEVIKAIDDSDDEVPFYSPLKRDPPIYMTPNRVTIPKDSHNHRARILSEKVTSESTDIW